MHIDANLRDATSSATAAHADGAALDVARPRPGGMTRAGMVGKYCVDFTLALLGIICLLPLFATVAVLIKLDSPGPVFFRQKRAGRNAKLFDIFKFRTMVQGAYAMGSRLTVKRDPRITRLGKLLRWSKIDELPQLFNVLRGDMSLIGPRPEDPHFVEFYTPAQRRVLTLRPGIVGPSQIRGRDEVDEYPDGIRDTERYYIEHILPPKLARDLEYVDQATFWRDMVLLVRGVWITARGAFRARYLWRRRRRIVLLGIDVVLAVTSYALALLIRFDWQWPAAEYTLQTLALVALVRPALLIYFGAYQTILSYFGLWDAIALFKAVTVGSVVAAGVTYFVGSQSHPRSVFVIDWALMLLMLTGSRYTLKTWLRRHPRGRSQVREKVIIVGAGHGGEQISRALMDDPSAAYRPVGFIDETRERWGARIHGVKILGGAAELRLALTANGVRVVFVCLSDLKEATAREVADICASAGVECRMLPALSELLSAGNFAVARPGTPTHTGPGRTAGR
jgi:lipopolysaccharide/colanic/teichoic acid biosynthesis glycosyltransferase